MKLLFDANLSHKIVPLLADLFPGSVHVGSVGLSGETLDTVIREYAGNNGFVIVTSDRDFVKLANVYGKPPQIIHLERMNYSTRPQLT